MIGGATNPGQAPSALDERIDYILKSPKTSHWLKQAVIELLRRDPIDAAGDADALAEVMTTRAVLTVGDFR